MASVSRPVFDAVGFTEHQHRALHSREKESRIDANPPGDFPLVKAGTDGEYPGGRAARPQKGQAVGEPSAGKIRGFEEIAAAVSIEQEGVFGVSNLPDGGILEMLLGQRSSQGKDIWCKGIYLFAYIPGLEAGGIAQAALQPVSEGEKRDKQEEEQGHWKIPGQPCRKAADIEGRENPPSRPAGETTAEAAEGCPPHRRLSAAGGPAGRRRPVRGKPSLQKEAGKICQGDRLPCLLRAVRRG